MLQRWPQAAAATSLLAPSPWSPAADADESPLSRVLTLCCVARRRGGWILGADVPRA